MQTTSPGIDVRLAWSVNKSARDTLKETRAANPALLVSNFYLKHFLKEQTEYHYRDWTLDSGAFSAFKSGKSISLTAYIETCKELIANDPTLVEVYSLDVIGDHVATLNNTEKMWAEGVQAIPCFHVHEPYEYLTHLASHYPKIALGGVALNKGKAKLDWATDCFARVWPKKIHGFAFGGAKAIMSLPWHSVDASNWQAGPTMFGRWSAFGGANLGIRGSGYSVAVEIDKILKLEREARTRWRKEFAKL